jgi:predicted dehydrogenase
MADEKVRIAAIGMNHDHIYGQVNVLLKAGAELVSFFAAETDLAGNFQKKYPQAKSAGSVDEILEDKSIHLICSAITPNERAALGIKAMQHGKDFFSDKPGFTTLKDLEDARRVQQQTHRIWSVFYGERLESAATIKAAELIKGGAIGKLVQILGLGPHRASFASRQPWFFDPKKYGGILCDIASHQADQFLFLTGADNAEVVFSQVANFHHPQYENFEDYGEMILRAGDTLGYSRIDWFSPDGLNTWGDGRLTVIGTDGYMEIRKNIDIGGRPGGNHLFVVDQKKTEYIDCSKMPLSFGANLIHDVLNRTETTMPQAATFTAMEIALKAQAGAKRLGHLK